MSTARSNRPRLRHIVPPVAATLVLALANFAFGAVQPVAALTLSAAITLITSFSIAAAGPRNITPGMIIGASLFVPIAVFEYFGPFHAAGAPLAVLFAAGCFWTLGRLAARQPGAHEAAWSALIWSSTAYCAWMFASSASGLAAGNAGLLAATFATAANASLLFGLLALVAVARVLHVLKQADAKRLVGLRLFDRMLREGLGGFLLLGFSGGCLVLTGSQPGLLIALGVLVAYTWWDTRMFAFGGIQGNLARLAAFGAPLLALVLIGLGVADGWLHDDTIAPGIGLTSRLPNLQRIDAYAAMWRESPLLGHGLGAAEAKVAAFQTLDNAKVMLAPGGAHNVFATWLVEGGAVGLALLMATLALMHIRVFTTLASRRAPRTFARTAAMATALLLLHGVTDSSLDLPTVTWIYGFVLGAACGLAPAPRVPGAVMAEAK